MLQTRRPLVRVVTVGWFDPPAAIEARVMTMTDKCRLCRDDFTEPDPGQIHHQDRCPIEGSICMGCFVLGLAVERFLIQKRDFAPMGFWTEPASFPKVIEELLAPL